jgi:predicted dehydrogenase
MTRPLRVGVAGLGFGASIHVPGFRQIAGVEVVALCGHKLDRTSQAARAAGIPTPVTSVEALLDLRLDAISLALPPAANTHGAALAVERGIAVLCEKPLAIDPAVASSLATAALGLTNGVDFQFAELDAFKTARELIDEERFGKLMEVHVEWLTMSEANRTSARSWKRSRSENGGVVTLLGTHVLYLLEWLCGPIATLEGESFVRSQGAHAPLSERAADDSAALTFKYASGALGRANVSNASIDSRTHSWELVFEEGTITLKNDTRDYMRGFRVESTDESGTRSEFVDTSSPEGDGRLPAFVRLASRFVAAVRASEPMKPDFEDAARVATLASLIHSRQ